MAKIKRDDSEIMQLSLRGKVFNQIENDILNGKYKPGDSLRESKLSCELGVSRTPVREAIRQLELEGLVSYIPNKGAVVKGLSEQDIQDIYEIRTLIEGVAARRAARSATKEQIKELTKVIEFEEFFASKGDTEQLLKLDTKFHEIIYRASGNGLLTKTLISFHHYIQKARTVSLETPKRRLRMHEEHCNIKEAIVEGDEEKAERLTIEHIKNANENLVRLVKDR